MTAQEKSFIESCFEGDFRGIKTCIKYGVNINVADFWCIEIVSRKGYSKIVKYFLENGISHKTACEKMVLAYSCDQQNIDLVKYLICNSDEYKNDLFALQWAVAKENAQIVELLLAYMEKYDGAFCSAASTGQVEILQLLIDNGIEKLDEGAERAVYWAAEKYKWAAVELLFNNNIGSKENLGEEYFIKYNEWKSKR